MNSTTTLFRKVYQIPLVLAAITIAGLLFALFGDGGWDTLSWIFLAIPVAVIIQKIVVSSYTD